MPRVPLAEPQVAFRAGSAPAPVSAAPPAAAFGVEVGQANERLGQTVGAVGKNLADHFVAMQEKADVQHVLDVQNQFLIDHQNTMNDPTPDPKTGIPKGYLARNLDQAKDSTLQYDQVAPALKQKYMAMVKGTNEEQQMSAILDAHITNGREQVIKNEAAQRDAAFTTQFNATIETNIQNSASLDDPKLLLNAIRATQATAIGAFKHLGNMDDNVIAAANRNLAGKMVKAAVEAQLEQNPLQAKLILDTLRDQIPPTYAADISKMIQGKLIDERKAGVWSAVNGHLLSTGEVDLAYAQKYIDTLKVSQEDKDKFFTYVHVHASIADQELKQFHDTHMRSTMLDMFDGKLTLSEAQRRFANGELGKSDFDILEQKLNTPGFAAMRSFVASDPETFNEIRKAQLTGSKSPGEIQRMIAQGAGSKGITPDDGKYLLTINSEKPPTPRDKYIEAQAKNLRDFGDRYFAESFLGMPIHKEKTSQEAHSLVSDFYNAVDKSQAQGEDIDKIRDRALKAAMQSRFPGLGNLDKVPDVVIDVKGRVVRVLNPDQHSGLKPKYRITHTGAGDKENK
jgi:hypothetical protein